MSRRLASSRAEAQEWVWRGRPGDPTPQARGSCAQDGAGSLLRVQAITFPSWLQLQRDLENPFEQFKLFCLYFLKTPKSLALLSLVFFLIFFFSNCKLSVPGWRVRRRTGRETGAWGPRCESEFLTAFPTFNVSYCVK